MNMKFLLTLLSRLYKERLIHYQFFMVLVYIFKYRLLRPLTMGPIAKYRPPSWRSGEPPKSLKETKIALICDDMTWKNFDGICKIVFLTPQNWREELEHFQPDLLFCESTWSGNEDHKGCWDYAVFHARKLPFDNRRALKRILRYCRAAALPTVFWNKEDPPMFRDQAIISFRDTAYLFDYVFTTAEECIEEYKTHGCQNVKTLMFGYSPKLFFPVPMEADCRVAAFLEAGIKVSLNAARRLLRCSMRCSREVWSWSSMTAFQVVDAKTCSFRNLIVAMCARLYLTAAYAMRCVEFDMSSTLIL